MRATRLGKRWLQLGQTLCSNTFPDAIISVHSQWGLVASLRVDPHSLDRDNFGLKVACFRGVDSFGKGVGCELILLNASDAVLCSDILGPKRSSAQ